MLFSIVTFFYRDFFSIVTVLEFWTDKNISTEENVIVGVPAEEGGGVIIIGVAVSLRTVCLKNPQ